MTTKKVEVDAQLLEEKENREVPWVLLVFTCVVCVGVMINVTVVIPTATRYGDDLLESALVISSYSVGAFAGLTLFRGVGTTSVRNAYLLHALFMIIGNFCYWIFTIYDSFVGVLMARLIVGLEGGVMYNGNLALIEFSGAAKRIRYLAIYQFFVGFGLIVGPGLSSISLLLEDAFNTSHGHTLVNLLMTLWGLVLGASLYLYMPSNNNGFRESEGGNDPGLLNADHLAYSTLELEEENSTPELLTDEENYQRNLLLAKIFTGNFLRITVRIIWEVGAITVMIDQYNWSMVTGGLVLGLLGGAQTFAQLFYAWLNFGKIRKSMEVLEMVEVLGIIAMFDYGCNSQGFTASLFIIASIVQYCANCLTSAPYNAIILAETSVKVDKAQLLLLSQYGIFLGFLIGPIIIRLLMQEIGDYQNVLASTVLLGWACQSILNVAVDLARPTAWTGALLGFFLSGMLMWAVLDRNVGGTGGDNIFSWHPIMMGFAYWGFMNAGQHAYTKGISDGFVVGTIKETQRRVHGVLMVLAIIVAIIGYSFIFTAHVRNGESQFGIGEEAGRLIHVWFGYVVLILSFGQALSGIFKALRLENTGVRIFKKHGLTGRIIVLLGIVECTIGIWLHMNYDHDGWTEPLKAVMTAFSIVLFGLVYLKFYAPPPTDIGQLIDINLDARK